MLLNENRKSAPVSPEAESYANYLLCLSLDIGEQILRSGGEINRVENTIERICRAYGAVHVEVFAIPSLILASVRMGDNSYSSQIRRVFSSSNHLSKLESFNRISRQICRDTPPLEEVDAMIQREKNKKPIPLWMDMVSYAMVGGFFAILFGGCLRDCLAAMLVSSILAIVAQIRSAYINQMAKTLLTSFVAGILSYISVFVGIGDNIDMIMIGTIMLLIPGLAFGNAIRDLLCGDTVAGILKTVQSCLSAILIACGYSLSIFLLGRYLPTTDGAAELIHPILVWIAALFGTLGFAGMFRAHPRHFPLIGAMGLLTYGIFEGCVYVGLSKFVAAFLAALFVTVCAETFARVFRAPTVVFLFTAPIVIVPGGSLYYAMSALLMKNSALLELHLQNTLQISIGIAGGIVAVSVLVQGIHRFVSQIKRNKKPHEAE